VTLTQDKLRRREMQGQQKRRDVEKERYWRRVIGEAARSGISIRRFCEQRKLRESQFYWWQRELEKRQQARTLASQGRGHAVKAPEQATFALVSEDGGEVGSAGIELVLRDGRRLRISKGVDEGTLRRVVGVLEEGC
jgi:hypothetical protein